MRHIHRISYSIAVLLWLILLFGCDKAPQKPSFSYKSHHIKLQLLPQSHRLIAVDTIHVNYSGNVRHIRFLLNKTLSVKKITVGNQALDYTEHENFDLSEIIEQKSEPPEIYQNARLYQINLPNNLVPKYIQIFYEGTIYDSLRRASFSRMNIADQTIGLIGEEGAFLSNESFWYPTLPHSLASFRITVLSPANYRPVTSGNLVKKVQSGDSLISVWQEEHPIDAIYMCAGTYEVQKAFYDDIEISTWFFPQSQSLAQSYLDASQSYIEMYSHMIGKYPFNRFSVVENFFPTGYGMPGFTLLGSQVIRLPFMTKISLGHEICHNWWGNGVFVDYSHGNWCEGLTTYLADYHYKELESPESARQYRYEVFKDYASYVTHDSLDFPLKNFRERTTPQSRVIGYGKNMMVFHQLRKILGDEAFYHAIRQVYREKLFQYASWRDLQSSFEKISNRNLDTFFQQWIDQTGAAEITLEKSKVKKTESGYKLNMTVSSNGPIKQFALPVCITTESATVDTLISMAGKKADMEYLSRSAIEKVEIDPNYDVFRRLSWQEIAPSLSQFFGATEQYIVLGTNMTDDFASAYSQLAEKVNFNKAGEILTDKEIDKQSFSQSSMLILGSDKENTLVNEILQNLPQGVGFLDNTITINEQAFGDPGDCCVLIIRNPYNKKAPVVWIHGRSPNSISDISNKLAHYGKYGFLAFRNGVNILKGNWPVDENPLSISF